jgi:hypothetical protein
MSVSPVSRDGPANATARRAVPEADAGMEAETRRGLSLEVDAGSGMIERLRVRIQWGGGRDVAES